MPTTYTWEVSRAHYPEVCALIEEAARLSDLGAYDKLEDVKSRLLRYPGYPKGRTTEDLVVVVPAQR